MNSIDLVLFKSKSNPQGQALTVTWNELCNRCRVPRRGAESMAQYAAASNRQRGVYKENGGFIAAKLMDNYRAADRLISRSLIVMDMDHCPDDILETLPRALRRDMHGLSPVQALAYTTHSSTCQRPRLRLIIRPNRHLTPKEYAVVCRYMANRIAAECCDDHRAAQLFDPCSWAACQMFYWPSCCKDADFKCMVFDGEPLDVDYVLGQCPETRKPPMGLENRAGVLTVANGVDIRQKRGLAAAGPVERAFCLAYPLREAIRVFLSDVYRPVPGDNNRFDYIAGEGMAGLVVSCDDLGQERACSFHSTDPAHGLSMNAYQLVGLHRFDARAGKGYTRQRRELREWAMRDEKVRREMARAEGLGADQEWQLELERNAEGEVKSTRGNVRLILEHDPDYRGMVYLDRFSGSMMLRPGCAPWSKEVGAARQWSDEDDALLRCSLQTKWGVSGSELIRDALVVVAYDCGFHPVCEWLEGLTWDGVPRLNALWVDYLGADDTLLNRAITELFFVAAVARVMRPGCKFDYCPVLKGPQGIGKSTVLNIMGGEWFTDSLPNTDSKDAMGVLMGRWIVEAGEFMAFKRSEREAVKRFISSEIDVYRPAYGRYTRAFPRQCVFCATTNEDKVLKGDDNRRLVPVECRGATRWGSVAAAMDHLRSVRDQLWAEAVALWDNGKYPLYLSREMEAQARLVQTESTVDEDDELRTALEKFITYPQPSDWGTYSLSGRQMFYAQTSKGDMLGYRLPEYVSIKEVLYEAYGLRPGDRRYPQLSQRLSKIMRETIPDWQCIKGSRHTRGLHGARVTAWRRPSNPCVLSPGDTGVTLR